MEYPGVVSQYYYNHPELQLANASYDLNSYFASSMRCHVGVASYYDTRYVTSANTFINAPHYTYHNYEYYGQEPMSTMNSLSFNFTSNIQHAYPYSSAISSQYVVPPQHMPMNQRIGLANYSQISYGARHTNRTKVLPINLTSYANSSAHNSASYVTNNYGQINEISARYASANAHDSASYVANNYGRIHENSARHLCVNSHDSASRVTSNHSRTNENSTPCI